MSLRHFLAALAVSMPLVTPVLAGSTNVTPTLAEFSSFQPVADVPPAPELSDRGRYLTNTETATFTGTIADFRAFLEANPITDFVIPTDAIPAIESITYLTGTWPEVDALRRVDLAGGHTVHERVIANTDDRFAYQIWNITAPSGRVINHIMGEFRYAQTGADVTVTWDYNIRPSLFLARPAIRGFLEDDFGPFMRAGLTGVVAAYQDQ